MDLRILITIAMVLNLLFIKIVLYIISLRILLIHILPYSQNHLR